MATLAAKKSSRLREFFLLLTSPFKLINQLRLRRKAKKEARKSDVEVHPLERICPAWLHVLQPPAKDDGAAKAAELGATPIATIVPPTTPTITRRAAWMPNWR